MGMFDTLPNGDQTKALGRFMRDIELGDKIAPFCQASAQDFHLAPLFAYPDTPEFTFLDMNGGIHKVINGVYEGTTNRRFPVHFNYLGISTGDVEAEPIIEADPLWQEIQNDLSDERVRE